jgi:hypothetical protein
MLVFESLEMDEDTREVTRAGHLIELTATEYRLLRYFLLHPRNVLSRGQLLDHVWEYDFGGDGRILETYVSYLRRSSTRMVRRSSTRCAASDTRCACRDEAALPAGTAAGRRDGAGGGVRDRAGSDRLLPAARLPARARRRAGGFGGSPDGARTRRAGRPATAGR